jgi:ribosomal-protein-alanine N-acetyltransferase
MTPVTISAIETERLILRGPVSADTEPLAAFIADPAFSRYIPKAPGNRTPRERAERLIGIYQQRWEEHPPSAMGWAAVRKADGQFIGICGVEVVPDAHEGELDYRVGPLYWGQGFATEAARAIVRFGFEHTAWERIVAAVVPANVASVRVVEHLGFVYEKDVNYLEMAGGAALEMESPIVAYYALRRERFVPGDVLYRVR